MDPNKEKKLYSFKIGLLKTLKNAAIFLLPSLVAYQTSVPQQYAGLLAMGIYFLKNYYSNK